MKTLIILIVILLTGCDQYDYSYNLEDYDLNVPEEGIQLTVDEKPWFGEYNGSMEPEPGYCGPTAVKNILWWYGEDMSYEQTATELKTDNWDPGLDLWKYCALACFGEVAVCANACYNIVKKQIEGTSIPDVIRVLTMHTPDEYDLHFLAEDPSSIDEIIYQVSNGNPVIVGTVAPGGELHLEIITGFEWRDDEIYTRMANGYDRYLDDFMTAWSTKEYKTKIARRVMHDFGLRPFTAMYFSPAREL